MPTIGWIDALRQYNAGMPSWCVPRKGTPGYERVMRIRQGEEKAKSFKEVLDELETKTAGKPKGEKKSMKIDLKTQSATLPTLDEAPKTDVPAAKSSTSNNKAMAIVPVNYVAEGGSKGDRVKSLLDKAAEAKALAEQLRRDQKENVAARNRLLDEGGRISDRKAYDALVEQDKELRKQEAEANGLEGEFRMSAETVKEGRRAVYSEDGDVITVWGFTPAKKEVRQLVKWSNSKGALSPVKGSGLARPSDDGKSYATGTSRVRLLDAAGLPKAARDQVKRQVGPKWFPL